MICRRWANKQIHRLQRIESFINSYNEDARPLFKSALPPVGNPPA